ncbi:MAG: AI-2E family transporter [Cyclobacteriaceae bacterium]|nr:AI-2E family transporter [Cyclobacteriaceae bacterium]
MNLTTEQSDLSKRVIQLVIQLGALVFIFGWCFQIISPFISPIIWGIIIAITIYPLFVWLSTKLKGKQKLSSILITVALLALIIVPVIFLAESLVDGVKHLREVLNLNKDLIPPPGENTKNWPSFAQPLVAAWQLASENLQAVMVQYKDQLTAVGKFLLGLVALTSVGILQFVLSIILAGIFLAYSDEGGKLLRNIYVKLAGDKGDELARVSEEIIRSVVKGILGVAVIQTLMAGIGFVVAGVPAAGLWTFFCLIFAIIQIGVGPIVIPVAIYLFNTADTKTAIIFAIWAVITLVSDNILKPLLLGRGAPVPMLVVFIGAIGGFMATGFLGLFLGAVILALGYKLFLSWLNNSHGQNDVNEADETATI